VVRSLAQRYKRGIEQLNCLLPEPVECLHIIGGGCRNKLLNRMTEEAIGIPVIAGPVEATAIGNIMVQAAL
jgi:rhamnulokinase